MFLSLVDAVSRVETSDYGFVFLRKSAGEYSVLSGTHPTRLLAAVQGASKDAGDFFWKLRDELAGGAFLVGYFGFDFMSLLEEVPIRGLPPFHASEMMVFQDVVRFRVPTSAASLTQACGEELQPLRVTENLSPEEFYSLVESAKRYIQSGDVFQVVLSRRIKIEFEGSLSCAFLQLVRESHAPYLYYLKFGERRIVGASPETLLRVKGRKAETFPIAGTTRCTGDLKEDRTLASDLKKNEKEVSEHVMLVDLARNDLGRVCDFGSIRVTLFKHLVRYPGVQHMVSKVTGILREGSDSFDAFGATFPAGTVCGAPKIRSAEIISELEPDARGPYAGAVGVFEGVNRADFAINIRSVHSVHHTAYVQAGAGIVADSIPEREYLETAYKAFMALKSVGLR